MKGGKGVLRQVSEPLGWLNQVGQGAHYRWLEEDAKVATHGQAALTAPRRTAALRMQATALSDAPPYALRRGNFLHSEKPLEVEVAGHGRIKGQHRASFDTQDIEDAVEKSEEAEAVTSLASAELRKVLEESNEASEDALAAAQVAVITEAVAFVGCLAGLVSSWIGWKMHTAQLPQESKIPSDSGVPHELLTPPPDRIDTTMRPSLKSAGKAPPQPKATVPSRAGPSQSGPSQSASSVSEASQPAAATAAAPSAVPSSAPQPSSSAQPSAAAQPEAATAVPPAESETHQTDAEPEGLDLTHNGAPTESF